MDKYAHLWWLVYFFGIYTGFFIVHLIIEQREWTERRKKGLDK